MSLLSFQKEFVMACGLFSVISCRKRNVNCNGTKAQPILSQVHRINSARGLQSSQSYTSGMVHCTMLVQLAMSFCYISMKVAEVEVSAKFFKMVGRILPLHIYFWWLQENLLKTTVLR